MSLLNKLKVATTGSVSDVQIETVTVTLESLSAPINGQYGAFRQVGFGGNLYNVDSSAVMNANSYSKGSSADVTIKAYTNKDGEEKTVIAAVQIHLPKSSGFFVMS